MRDVQTPTPRLRQVVVDTRDARASAEFWRQLLGLVYRAGHEPPAPGEPDPAGSDWLNLRTPDGTPCLAFQQVEQLAPTTWPRAAPLVDGGRALVAVDADALGCGARVRRLAR